MTSPDFGALARLLRDRGVAPKYAARLCAELRDHYEDLEAEALRAQRSAPAAAAEARLRLGDESTIAAECAARPELKLWVYRSGLLLGCLRALSCLWLAGRVAAGACRRRSSDFGRFACAAAAAAVVTAALLLGLEISTMPRAPGAAKGSAQLAAHDDAGAHGSVTVVADVADVADVASTVGDGATERLTAAEQAPTRARPQRIVDPAPQPDRALVANAGTMRIQISVDSPPPIGAPQAHLEFTGARLTDGEYAPIVKVAPTFPARAAMRGLEGYVVLEYTITPSGSVQDVIVVESTDGIFEESAVQAISQFKYKPRIVQGRPVHVHGVRTKVNFKIEA